MLNVVTIKDVKLKIGVWCKQKRREYNISQNTLAEKLALSRITIQQLEAGKNVTIDTLLKVADHFNSLEAINDFFENEITNANIDSLY